MLKIFKNKRLAGVIPALMLALLFTTGDWARAGDIGDSLAEAMAAAGSDEQIPVIIRFTDTVDVKVNPANGKSGAQLAELLQENAHASQGLVHALLRAEGIQKIVSLWIINGIAVQLTADQIIEFANHADVESIVLDDTVPAPAGPATELTTSSSSPWDNLGAIHAPAMWSANVDGTGVVVATMDTGVKVSHPDLSASWRGGANSWYDPHGEHATPFDSKGHGTAVMGVMVGGSASGTPIGVAPGARWIAVKIFSDAGSASYSDIHLGYQWLLDPDGLPDTEDAPHVINNSWGLSGAEGQCIPEFQQDVQALKSAGIAVVFSGGNNGPNDYSNTSPANYPESFAVGAVDASQTIADFSGRGPSACGGLFPEVSAPGVGIYTADKSNGYVTVDGTSVAAPHAAGAMALLKDAYPGATADELEQALMLSAADLGEPDEDNAYGYGLIDVAEADSYLDNPPGCTDGDNDGYFAAGGCGTLIDCDDGDVGLNPSTTEVKHDGIDQNCNGYDLTVDIINAVYLVADSTLNVEATSDLGKNADLELLHFGAMRWNRKQNRWTLSVTNVSQAPEIVTVGGIEGYTLAFTAIDASTGSGGGKGGGKGKNK